MTRDERASLLFMLDHDDPSVRLRNIRQFLESREPSDDVYEEVEAECVRQASLWGDDHDDEHDSSDWNRILMRYVGKADEALEERANKEWRGRIVQIAAIAASALRSHDRKEQRR